MNQEDRLSLGKGTLDGPGTLIREKPMLGFVRISSILEVLLLTRIPAI